METKNTMRREVYIVDGARTPFLKAKVNRVHFQLLI